MSGELTKKLIMTALAKLLNERPLEHITVKDIVEECGIGRNTFYYHYQDVYAVLEDIFEREATQVVAEHKPLHNWQDGFLESTRFAMENKNAVYHVYNSVNRDQLERYLYRVAAPLMQEFVKSQAAGLDVSEEDIACIAIFYKHAVVGILLEWLQRGMKDDPEALIRRMGSLFEGNIRITLERAAH